MVSLPPNSKHRAEITPAKRGKGKPASSREEGDAKTPSESRAAMTWAQRLKRVFNIDIQTCPDRQGPVKIIAASEDPDVIHKNLTHLTLINAFKLNLLYFFTNLLEKCLQ